VITDIQKTYLQAELDGKIKKRQNPRKHSAYKRRIRERIDHMIKNTLWTSRCRPEIMQDREYENSEENIPRYRRARALLKAVSLFEREDVVLSLIADIYSNHQLEVSKKK